MLKKLIGVAALICLGMTMNCCGMHTNEQQLNLEEANVVPISDNESEQQLIQQELGVTRIPNNLKSFRKRSDTIQLIFNINSRVIKVDIYNSDFGGTISDEKKIDLLNQAEQVATFVTDKRIPPSVKSIVVSTLDLNPSIDLVFGPGLMLKYRLSDIQNLSNKVVNEMFEQAAMEAHHRKNKMPSNIKETRLSISEKNVDYEKKRSRKRFK